MTFLKFILGLFLSPLLVCAVTLNLSVTPLNIKLGLTSQLDINCSVPVSIYAITISHSADAIDPTFTDIAIIDLQQPAHPLVAGSIYSVHGVSSNEVSYLSLQWKYPNASVSGLYRCIAMIENDVELSAEAIVTQQKPDSKDLFAELDAIRAYLQAATHNATDIWEKRLEDARSAVFYSSARVGDRMYHLSKYSNVGLEQAEVMCSFQGGYLAEVDNEQEMISIKDFLSSVRITNDTLIVIAGSDAAQEGQWQFTRKPIKTTPFLSWAPGHPSNASGNNNNCLALDVGRELNMVDVSCSRSEQHFRSRFLCEVPHAPFASGLN